MKMTKKRWNYLSRLVRLGHSNTLDHHFLQYFADSQFQAIKVQEMQKYAVKINKTKEQAYVIDGKFIEKPGGRMFGGGGGYMPGTGAN